MLPDCVEVIQEALTLPTDRLSHSVVSFTQSFRTVDDTSAQ